MIKDLYVNGTEQYAKALVLKVQQLSSFADACALQLQAIRCII